MRKLYLLILAYVVFASQLSYAQEEVTFQGSIARGAFTLKTGEVSGSIIFGSGGIQIEKPFLIPAGHSKVAYEETVPWSIADDGIGYITISALCTVNCESNNINGDVFRDAEGNTQKFGLGDRDDAYIADLTLPRLYSYLTGRIELPEGVVAKSDIEIDIFADHRTSRGYSNLLGRLSGKAIIKSGENHTQYKVPLDFSRADSGFDSTIYLGYHCLSVSCEDHYLTKQGWLGDTANNNSLVMTTALSSSASLSYAQTLPSVLEIDNTLAITPALTLFENISLPVLVSTGKKEPPSRKIEGRIIVYKQEHKIECLEFYDSNDERSIWDGTEYCYIDTYGAYLDSFREVISQTAFTINKGSLDTRVNLKVEPLQQDRANIIRVNDTDKVVADSQYVSFICDEGCDDFAPDQSSYYLGSNRSISGLSEANAHQFYLTEEFYQNEIVINLARIKAMPWLEYLLDDKPATLSD